MLRARFSSSVTLSTNPRVDAVASCILTLNAGSSSLKLGLFDRSAPPRRLFSHGVSRIGQAVADHAKALDAALAQIAVHGGVQALAAVGHRIVHGGQRYASPEIVTPAMLDEIRRLAVLDPDHLPAEIAIVEAMRARAPSLPQIACFDTAFHRTMPRVARLLPIPRHYEADGLQRYGFHGLSYQYLVEALSRVAGDAAARGRVVMAHLGSGASLAAIRDGRCVDTTMGFTPNSGVAMGTRSGDLDPGVVLYLLRTTGGGADDIDDILSRKSGLLGVSETSSDMRDLLERRATDPRAADAVAIFCHGVRKAIGALATSLGGLETLVFSGGIGENAAPIREEVARGLEHLGVRVDPARNASSAAVISDDGSPCTVRVIRTDEESIIARETLATIGGTT
jgi:acetate kinase